MNAPQSPERRGCSPFGRIQKIFFRSNMMHRHADMLEHEMREANRRGDILDETSAWVFSRALRRQAKTEQRRGCWEYVTHMFRRK